MSGVFVFRFRHPADDDYLGVRRRLPQVTLELANGRIYATGIEEGVA